MAADATSRAEGERLRRFTQKLLADVQALERILEEGLIEAGKRRIGAEQELFLVDRHWRPAPVNMEVLEDLDDPRFTTELGRFNMEFNLDPIELGPRCLHQMEEALEGLLGRAREAAARRGARLVLTGILPTIEKSDLTLDNLTPRQRYAHLNEAMTRLRGDVYELRIKGYDELQLQHDNVMLEACNTSFQVHFQVRAEEFARLYNIAQAVAGPVLAAGTNSPLLFGKRLWRESRIPLFQQSVDTRAPSPHLRELTARVSFGRRWVDESVLEIIREDIARYRILLSADIEQDPFAELDAGRAPKLEALQLFNGTVYRWTRPCYGISDGKPHLRIENRVLPSGPTVLDEMGSAAFWFGLMASLADELDDVRRVMDFAAVKENFIAAGRLGLGAQFTWGERRNVPAAELIGEELLPRARSGLQGLGVTGDDIDRYLGVVEERVRTQQTGSQWILDSWAALRDAGTPVERLAAITAGMTTRQEKGEPVHEWEPARLEEAGGWRSHYLRVAQVMTTDLFTVNQDELIDLVACLMDWQHIRHVPVEDHEHRLVGLVTHRSLLRRLARERSGGRDEAVPVRDIMETEVVTTTPETSTLEAIRLMKERRIGCLPVVEEGRLIGLLTERNFLHIAGQLLEEWLEEPAGEGD